MTTVHDVNVTPPAEFARVPGARGAKVASEVNLSRTDRPASSRTPWGHPSNTCSVGNRGGGLWHVRVPINLNGGI